MSNPNQANINTYLLGTYSTNLTATLSTIIQNAANSNGVLKVNSILFNNYSATLNSNITLRLNKFNAGNVNLHNKLAVPANSRNYFLNRNAFLVLNEGDSLSANTDANNANVAITIGYEELSEKNLASYQLGTAFAIEYLVVAGGGGTNYYRAGGGGAGGFRTGSCILTSANVGANLVIIVGAGGSPGGTGSNSCFDIIRSTGGGVGGGSYSFGVSSGGSGGGNYAGNPGAAGNLGGYTPAEGCPGGDGGPTASTYYGGGGGGAGESGYSGSSPVPARGGNGRYSDISGLSKAYAGGGGGGSLGGPYGVGGDGGGGGGADFGIPGTVNSGGGGGGGAGPINGGGAGGSGIVIIRHPAVRTAAVTTGNVTISANAGYRIYQFNGSGSISFPSVL